MSGPCCSFVMGDDGRRRQRLEPGVTEFGWWISEFGANCSDRRLALSAPCRSVGRPESVSQTVVLICTRAWSYGEHVQRSEKYIVNSMRP